MLGQRQQRKGDTARGHFSIHLLCTCGHKPPALPLPTSQEHVRSMASRASSAQPGASTLRLPQDPGPDTLYLLSMSFPLLHLCKGKFHMPGQGLRVPTKPGLSPGSDTWAGQQAIRAKKTGREPDILGEFLAQQLTLFSPRSRGVGVIMEAKSKTRTNSQLPGGSLREEELLAATAYHL